MPMLKSFTNRILSINTLVLCYICLLSALLALAYPLEGGLLTLLILDILLLKNIRDFLATPLLVVFAILNLYILPRFILIKSGVFDFCSFFQIDIRDEFWVLAVAVFGIFTILGYNLLPSNSALTLVRLRSSSTPHTERKHNIYYYMCVIMVILACAVWALFVKEIGGLGSIFENYTTKMFFEVVESSKLSMLKNSTVYFLFSGLSLFLALPPRKGLVYKLTKYVILAVALVILISFTRRGYIITYLMIIFVSYYCYNARVNFKKIIITSSVFCFIMYLMYIIRSNELSANVGGSILLGFNTAEFWVYDQFVNVIQNGNKLIGYDYGVSFLKSPLAIFMSYDKYISLDKRLVIADLGIQWGIPPTVIGYLTLVGGPIFLPVTSFVFGFMLKFIERFLVLRFTCSPLYIALYTVFMDYTWNFVRIGDPIISVFYANRLVIMLILADLAIRFTQNAIFFTRMPFDKKTP